MSKNRSAWSVLLAVVLAMVVMAGLAVTAFAETVTDPAELEKVLNGTQAPAEGVNYDADGNGIVEWDDLAYLNGTQVDLLPDGVTNDWLGAFYVDADMGLPAEYYAALFKSSIARGDSTKALHLNAGTEEVSGLPGYALLVYAEPLDLSGKGAICLDTLFTGNKGSITVTLLNSNLDPSTGYTVVLEPDEAGWMTNVIDLGNVPEDVKSDIMGIDFTWDGTNEVCIDNLQAVEGNVTYVAGANGVTELFEKYVIAGRPYGALPTPVRPFYTFVGWYADAEFENEVTAETIVAAADSCTLYAKWEAAESGVPMSEGGKNAILSVIPGVEDIYLYSVETPSAYEHRYLNIDLQNVTAPVVSIDFKFTSVTDANGAQITPAMYFSDRQDSGVFGAYYVIVNKATGELATTLAKDVEYTAYITLKDAYHKSLKMIPMGNANNGYKYSVEVSTPVYHEDAPKMGVFMIPSSGNHAMMSWYKSAEGEWQYAYAANNELPLLAYTAGNTYAQNTAYLRRIQLGAGAATTEVRFDFQYKTAKNGDETLVAFGLNNGGTITIQNTDGTAVTGNPVEGQWYTAVITKGGTSMGTAFDIYTLGNDIDGSDTNDVQVELFIKNLRAKKAVSAEDGSATMSGALVNDDKANLTVLSNGADAKSFAVMLSNSGYKQFRFQMKLDAAPSNFAVAYSFSDSITGTYNNPVTVIMDENHKAVRAADVQAGKWYTVVIYGTNDLYSNGSYNVQYTAVVPASGTVTITSDANVQIRGLEALSGQFGYRMYGAEIGWAKVDLSAHGYSYGYDMSQTGASEWASRTEIAAQGGQYSAMTYDFYIYEAGAEVPNFTGTWKPVFTIRGTDTVVANADLQANTWYTATVDMSNWSTGTYYQYVGNFANSQFKAYMANVCFVPAAKMFDNINSTISLDNDGDSTTKETTSYSASGMTVTLEKNGADGDFWADRIRRDDMRGTYRVSGTSDVWSDRALKIKLLDTSKELVQVDVRFLVSKDAEGKHIAPTLNVYGNTSGTPESVPYIIVDKDDNPVTELVTGNWYRIFITTQGKSNFTIVPAIEGEVEFLLDNLATYNTDELNVTLDASAQIGVTLSRFGDLQYAYANTAGANTITVKPNIAASKQVRFQFVLRELGTPAMTVSGAQIVIKDASGSTVNAADLEANTWYTAVITNSDNALGSSLTLNVGSGSTKMVIKDLVAYLTTDEPAAKTQNAQFHGLNKDEMMIAGFIGPRDEYYRGYVNMPSMVRDDIFKLLADAGINYVTDNGQDYRENSTHASQEILRLAAKYGINYFIKATDVATVGDVTSTNNVTIGNANYTHENYYNHIASYSAFAAKLAEMSKYDSFGGLFLRDEPSSELFSYIAQAKQHTTQYNTENGTDLNVFANLLPGVGWYRWSNGSETHTNWQAYIQDFISTANVGYAFFDMYPIQGAAGNIEDAYIEYMGHIAYTATKNGIPWMGCVQVGGQQPSYGSTKREPTENEMHWNVNSLLAFGAKGLDYYILVAPPYFGDDADMNAQTVDNHSLITINGDTTAYYNYVSGINKHVKAIDHVLMTSTHKGVIFTGSQLTTYNYSDSDGVSTTLLDTTAELNSVKLNSISAAHALTGAFDYNGKTALLVVNNSLNAADTVTLNLTGTYYPEIIYDAKTTMKSAANSVTLNLAAGHSALVILHTSAVSIDSTVAFDVNYAGATSSYESKTVSVGKTYGELPTPERAGYVFDGWYLYADGSGDKITATTVVATSGAHVLYAKWTLPADTNPVAVQDNAEYNPNNAKLTRSVVDGKNVYTYTTRGVNNPTTDPWGRRANIKFTAGAQTHVALEFRYTEAYHADGTTAFAPSLGVYSNNEGNGGSWISTIDIFDSKGVRVTGSNAKDGLNVGEWYTLVVGVKSNTSSFELRTAHNYTTDAAILTMEIRDRSTYTSNGIVPSTVETFARPGLLWTEADGWHYFIPNNGNTTSAWNRRTQIALPEDGMVQLTYEAKINNVSGNATNRIRVSTGRNEYYDLETGELLSTSESTFYLEIGKWYKIVHTSNDLQNMGTSGYTFCYPGDSGNTGNISLSFRNFSAKAGPEYLVSFDLNGAEGTTPDPITVKGGSAYGNNLPVVEWAGYTFGGWYTNAACTGSAVTATTTVSGTHTLYAKWILPEDTNSVVVEYNNSGYNPNQVINTRTIVDGKNVYTYTTRGVSYPTNDPWARRLNISIPEGQTHIVIEFRYTEAFKADGVTPIEPSLGVYNGTSGVGSPKIYDKNGKLVAEGNAKTGLTVGEWYTVIIEPGSYTSFAFWTAHNYTTDAAILTMEIRDRGVYNGSADAATLSTPWGVMPDPALSMVDGEVMYVIWAKDANQAAYYRAFRAVMKQDKMGQLSFEYKMSNVNGGAVVGITGMKSYDLTSGEQVTDLQPDTWYRAVYSTGANLGTGELNLGYLGGDSSTAGGFDMYIRNIRAAAIGSATVSFDGNYDGAETFDSVTVEQGATYGTLPTPAVREGYTFGGWYTDAACSGTAVSATDIITGTHTLYAKWTLPADTNPVMVQDNAEYNPNNAKLTRSVVDGKNVYTYTTRGVNNPTTDPWGRRANIMFTAGAQTHVALEFRYTEAYHADGTTAFAPSLAVYSHSEGNGGSWISTIDIYDSKGVRVTGSNNKDGLTVGEWYTLIVGVKSNTDSFELRTAHNYTDDAAILTMEIRDRGTYTAPGTFTTAWGAMPDPMLHFVDGEFQYDIIGNAATATGEQRQMNLTLSTDGMTHVMYEVMVENPTGGATAKISNSKTVFYDLDTGMKVTSFEEGKWYGATYTTGSNLGTAQLNLGYTGSDSSATGGIDVHVRNLRAFAADTNTAAAIATETYWGTLYRTDASTYRWATTNAVSNGSEAALYQRAIKFTNPLTTAAVMKVDFRFLYCTDSSGNNVAPNMWSNVTGGKFVVVDPENGEVMGSLEVGKTYSMYMTLDASASANMQVCYNAAAGLRAALEIVSSEAIATPASSVTMTPNSVGYGNIGLYQYNGEWAYGYSRYDGIHSEAAGNTDYRKIVVNLDGTAYTTLSFKFLYDEATNNGSTVTPIQFCTGYTSLTTTITDAAGGTVAAADMVAGQWYNVTVAMADGSALTNLRFFPAGMGNAASDTANVNIRLRFKDFVAG